MDLIQTIETINALVWATKWLPPNYTEPEGFRDYQNEMLKRIIKEFQDFNYEDVKVMKVLLKTI